MPQCLALPKEKSEPPLQCHPGIHQPRLWWVLGGAALAFLIVLRLQFGLTFVVGESMSPSFGTGDLLLMYKQAYRNQDPKRGDIVVAQQRTGFIVKRVAGLPGEEVEVKRGRLIINGEKMEEPYWINPGMLQLDRGLLAPGKFALLGDNRALPPSMVMHAIVTKDQIVGEVICSIRWSWLARR